MSKSRIAAFLIDFEELAKELASMEDAARETLHLAPDGREMIAEFDLLTSGVEIDEDELCLTHENSLSAQDLDSIIWFARLGFLHAAQGRAKKSAPSQN